MTTISRQIANIIYRLKRERGVSIDLVNTSSTTNLTTGIMTDADTTITVNRAVILPIQFDRDTVYSLTMIAANKNFAYGGYFDVKSSTILIDAKDVPTSFEIDLGTKIIYDNQYYEVSRQRLVLERRMWELIVKTLEARPDAS